MKTYVLCFTLLIVGVVKPQPTGDDLPNVLEEVQKRLKELEGFKKTIEKLEPAKKSEAQEKIKKMIEKFQQKKGEHADIKKSAKIFKETVEQVNRDIQEAFTKSLEKLNDAIGENVNSDSTNLLAQHVEKNLNKIYEQLLLDSQGLLEKLYGVTTVAQVDIEQKAADLQNPEIKNSKEDNSDETYLANRKRSL